MYWCRDRAKVRRTDFDVAEARGARRGGIRAWEKDGGGVRALGTYDEPSSLNIDRRWPSQIPSTVKQPTNGSENCAVAPVHSRSPNSRRRGPKYPTASERYVTADVKACAEHDARRGERQHRGTSRRGWMKMTRTGKTRKLTNNNRVGQWAGGAMDTGQGVWDGSRWRGGGAAVRKRGAMPGMKTGDGRTTG